jgi:transposase
MSVDANDAESGGRVRRHRRRWSGSEKRRIVAESYAPGSSVSRVARRYDLNANLLFTWRRQLGAPVPDAPPGGFVPMVIGDGPTCGGPTACEEVPLPAVGDRAAALPRATGRIEIVLAGGDRVIVDGTVDAAALARVVMVLDRRSADRSLGEGR